MVQPPFQPGINVDLNPLDDAAEFLLDKIGGALDGLLESAGEKLSGVLDKITGGIQASISFVRHLPELIQDKVEILADDTINLVGMTVEGLQSAAVSGVRSLVDRAEQGLDDAIGFARDVAESGFQQATEAFSGVVSKVQSGLADIVDRIGDTVAGITLKLQQGLAALGDQFRQAADVVGDSLGVGFTRLAESLDTLLVRGIDNLLPGNIEDWVTEIRTVLEDIPELRDLGVGDNPAIALLGLVGSGVVSVSVGFAIPLLVSNFLSVLLQPISQIALQNEQNKIQWQYLPLAEQIGAFRRGLIDREQYFYHAKRMGYREGEIQLGFELSQIEPNEAYLTEWFLRGEITDQEFGEAMLKLGWEPSDYVKFRSTLYRLPPVQDLITMAVREVFTPEVATRFGQFEDIPQEFITLAGQVGLSEEWARNYWASHWALPSIQMGFEMLHRRVIDESDIDLLLKSQDVMPFWRDRIKQISYSPLTRVDVRRMHATGVIDDAEVYSAYLDLGYNDVNAQRLTEFTIKLTETQTATPSEDETDLTKTDIRGLYEDGIITRDEAEEFFRQLGIDPDEAGFLLDRVELDLDVQRRKSEIQLVLARAQSGEYDFSAAQAQLNALELTDQEFNNAIGKLTLIVDKRTKLPTKKEVLTWFKDGNLTEDEARVTLGLMGYRTKWVDLYISTVDNPDAISDTDSPIAFEGEL